MAEESKAFVTAWFKCFRGELVKVQASPHALVLGSLDGSSA